MNDFFKLLFQFVRCLNGAMKKIQFENQNWLLNQNSWSYVNHMAFALVGGRFNLLRRMA